MNDKLVTDAGLGGAPCDMAPAKPRRRKRAEIVAQDIVADIIRREQEFGAKLPMEGQLLAEYAVSRSSLREALRLLEVQGLITIRPGPGSGTEVGRVDPANLAGTLALYLTMARVSLSHLLSTWQTIEPILAHLAAENRDRERVAAAMRPFVSDAGSAGRAIAAGLAFHDIVADLADNPVMSLLFGAIGHLVTEQIRIAKKDFELSTATVHAHHAIADAILAGDGPAAARLMREHLDEATREIQQALSHRDRDILLTA